MALGLREKLLLPTLAIIAAGLLLTVYLAYERSSTGLAATMREDMERDAAHTARQIRHYFRERLADLQGWGRTRPCRNALRRGTAEDRAAAERELIRIEETQERLDALILCDREGRLLAGSLAEADAARELLAPALQRQVLTGAEVISEVFTCPRHGRRVFVAAVPVQVDGEILGVMASSVSMESFREETIGSYRPERGAYPYVVDGDGLVLLHPDPSLVGSENIGRYEFGGPILNQAVGSQIYFYRHRKLAAWHVIDYTGWVYVQTLSMEAIYATSRETGLAIAVPGLAVLLAVTLAVLVLYRRMVSERLAPLVRGVRALEAGDSEAPIPVDPEPDELGLLARALNSMSERLTATLRDLRGEVRRRQEAQEALRHSEEQHRSVVEHAHEGILVVQEERLVFVNPRSLELTGYERSEILKLSLYDLIQEDDRERMRRYYRGRLRGEEIPGRYEIHLRRADGSTRWVEVHAALVDWQGATATMIFFHDITERRQALQALEESEEKFRFMTEQSLVAVALLQEERILYANQALAELTGYSVKRLQDGDVQDLAGLVHPEDRERIQAFRERRLAGEEDLPEQYEYRIVRRGGEVRWVQQFAREVRFQGAPCILVAVVDITERRRGEELARHLRNLALRLAGAGRLEKALEACLDAVAAVVECRGCGFYLDRGEAGLELVAERGLSEAFLAEARWLAAADGITRRIRQGDPFFGPIEDLPDHRHEALRREGFDWTALLPVTDDGEVMACLTIGSAGEEPYPPATRTALETIAAEMGGVLRRLQATEELRESRESLSITLDAIGDGVIATDTGQRVQRMNPVAEELTGWPQSEARGRPLREVMPILDAETGEALTCPAGEVLAGGERRDLDEGAVLVDRDGNERPIADSAAPIRDPEGACVGVVVAFRDVSSQRQMEEQLRQAQKMESIGRLAGGVAHDFNNLLGGMMGYAELLARRLEDQTLRQYAETVLQTGERAASLTEKLLAFGRKSSRQNVPVDLHELVREVFGLLRHSLDPRIALRSRLRAEPAVVRGDPSQLQTVLMNLCVNAGDAMPDGGTLTVATELAMPGAEAGLPDVLAPDERYLRLEVRDTGVGMTPETQEHIFEPFYTTKGVGEGTGLGLAMVYGTIRSHGGTIEVQSEPGKGTLFRLYLPLAEEALEEGELPRADEVVSGSGHILLVDDEEVIRDLGGDLLKELGYEVTTAADGPEAVDLYRREPQRYDLVILDMVMPTWSGRQTYARLREVDPAVPVLVSSGYSLGLDLDELRQEGILGFIPKPYKAAALSQQVARALQASPPG
jgi:PAS domain S-box-containing protein